jgi:hypothetical protein
MTIPTNIGRPKPAVTISTATGGSGDSSSGQVPTSNGSNGIYFGPNVATITSNGSNLLTGPFINIVSGSGTAFSASSNTLTIQAVAPSGSTSITANTSNTIQPVNLISGADIHFAATGSSLTISSSANKDATILFVIDGGGSTITTGIKGDLKVDFPCTINQWTLLADQSGSIVVDVWKDTYANYPPVVGDSITASAKPTISSATKGQSGVLTGWTTAIAAGDTLRLNVDSVTTCQRVTLALRVRRT